MDLKEYQKDTLATLGRFFRDARVSGPKAAYETIVKEPEQKKRLGRYAGDYHALEAVPQAPYVCLRCRPAAAKPCSPRIRSPSPAIPGSSATIRWCCGWCRPPSFVCKPWRH